MPAAQLVQTEAPAAENLPAAQSVQGSAAEYWPASHQQPASQAFVTALLSKKLTHRAKSASGTVWPLLRDPKTMGEMKIRVTPHDRNASNFSPGPLDVLSAANTIHTYTYTYVHL